MSDLLAKLLSSENISVVRKSCNTASFNLVDRVLTIPIFKDGMIIELEHMFIGHEVGHALKTDRVIHKNFFDIEENKKYFDAINITEDVRIDNLIKQEYPGLRRDYIIGLAEIKRMDFFRINSNPLSELSFMDRVNIFFKGYPEVYLTFTNEEYELVKRIENSSSQEESQLLGVELYDMSVVENKEKLNSKSKGDIEEVSGDTNQVSDDKTEEVHPECKTQKALDEQMSKLLAEDDMEIISIVPECDTDLESFIFPVAQVLNTFPFIKDRELVFNKLKSDLDVEISYLVKEFDMKKAATRYANQQVSKSGKLDVSKLYKYKFDSEIFKNVVTVKDDKNHGLIFLLDWSGSMKTVLSLVLRQLYMLTTFCRRVNIPFKVYAFAENRKARATGTDYTHKAFSKLPLSKIMAFRLIEFFNSDMSEVEYNLMYKRLIAIIPNLNLLEGTVYTLGSTPLNSSLVWMYFFLPKFKAKYNIEKMTLMVLSDGESHPVCDNSSLDNALRASFDKYSYGKRNTFFSVISPVTAIEYPFEDVDGKKLSLNGNLYGKFLPSTFETSALVRLIKETGVKVCGLYVSRPQLEHLKHGIMCLTCKTRQTTSASQDVLSGSIKSFYDEAVIVTNKDISGGSLLDSINGEDIDPKLTAAQLAKKVNKKRNTKNKVVLDMFIRSIV